MDSLVNESNDDVSGINSLPDEIILEVFSYLKQNQLGQIARVCRRWSVLTKSPLLWKNVTVKFFPSRESQLFIVKSFINRLPSCVTSIRLEFKKFQGRCRTLDYEELCVRLQEKCPDIKVLILTDCEIFDSLPAVIDFTTQFLQEVKILVFHRCVFPGRSARVEVDGTSKIEVLDLSMCRFGGWQQLSKMPYLKKLCLYGTELCNSWFLDDISLLKQLQVLNLGGYKGITAMTFPTIQNHGLNLKELYLCWVKLYDHEFDFNKSVFPHLQTICLRGSHIAWVSLISFIQSCPDLQNVYVHKDIAKSFSKSRFVVANCCKSGIVKAIDSKHIHKRIYLDD